MRNLLKWPGRQMIAVGAAIPLTLGLASAAGFAGTTHGQFQSPQLKHVWYIELENEGTTQTFGDPAADPYLARTLPRMGALLKNYYAIGHDSADNYIAQISGQAPDPATQNDCGVWTRFKPGHEFLEPYHQLVGNGCVYPPSVPTLGNQLSSAQLSWKAYMQDMGNVPSRDHTTQTAQGPACGHPKVGTADDTEGAVPADQYATRHEGFMYFESVIGDQAYCDAHVAGRSPSHPNTPLPGMQGPGGGKVGAVLLSPFIKPGTVSKVDYNHYSTLRSIEDIFGLSHLGDAAMPQVKAFGPDVYSNS